MMKREVYGIMSGKRLGAVILCLFLLEGCGSRKSKQVELTMWLVGSEAQARTINTLAAPFTEKTGVKIRCEAISWGEAHSKYLTAVAGGVEPDIGTMGLTWGIEFGRLGALINLKKEFPDQVAEIQKKTFPGLWESVEQGNQVFGIPLDLSVQVLYYRKDIIAEPPQTWQELTDLLQRLKKDNRRMIIDWGNLSWIGYAPFLWQAGGDFYTPDKSAASLNTPEAAKAMEFFRDLYTKHDVPRTSIPIEQGLRTGDFPLVISGNWKIVSLSVGVPEIAGKWAIGLLPKGPGGKRTAFLGGRIMGVFNRSPHRSEAWQFVKYLFEPSVQQELYKAGIETQDAYLPPNMATWDNLPMDAAMKSVLKQQSQEAKGPPAVVGWTETTHVLETSIQQVLLKDSPIQAELAKADDAMNTELHSTVH